MSRLPRISGRDCVKALGKVGFYLKRRNRSLPPPSTNIFMPALDKEQGLFYRGLSFERYTARDLDSATCMFQ